jgi:NTP pyrophosphatase (non-canonical NTP hydrolase)
MTLKNSQTLAIDVKNLYDRLNKKAGQSIWTAEDYLSGLMGDIGDLHKLLMAKNNKRSYKGKDMTLDQAIEHEMADILWSVFVLAEAHGVDVDKAFTTTMAKLKTDIDGKLGA